MNQFINFKTGKKSLQFGTPKCIKMHIGRTKSEILCKDLVVGGWNVEVDTDPVTGVCSQSDIFKETKR